MTPTKNIATKTASTRTHVDSLVVPRPELTCALLCLPQLRHQTRVLLFQPLDLGAGLCQ